MLHEISQCPSGTSALKNHGQKTAEKIFVSKEPRKTPFPAAAANHGAAKKPCAMLVLPNGAAMNRTERRHDEPNDVKRGDADSSGRG